MVLGCHQLFTQGIDPGLEGGELQEAHSCLGEGGLCHDGLPQGAMRSMLLGACRQGSMAIDGDCKGGLFLRELD